MSENAFLAQNVDLNRLAEMTKNFSGAEIEGLVKDAAAYALNRNINFDDLHAPLEEHNIKVPCGRVELQINLTGNRLTCHLCPPHPLLCCGASL